MRFTNGVGRSTIGAMAILVTGLLVAACGGVTTTPNPVASGTAAPATPAGTATAAPTSGTAASAAPEPSAPGATSTLPAEATATPAATVAPATPTPAPTVAPTPAPTKGPAKGKLDSTGTKGLSVSIIVSTVTCQLPTPGGLQIFVLGQFGANGPGLNMHITPTALAIDVDTGAGTTFHSRSFTGTGVTNFDAAVGVQIDSQLTEVTASGANTTGIGKLTSLTGNIDCGNQTPGSSTLVLTGTTPEGDVNGMIDPVRVGCNNSTQYGRNAQAFGVINVGTTPVTAIVNVNYRGFSVYLTGTGVSHFYNSPDATTSSVTDTGAQISGDAVTAATAAVPALTIHVEGADICGT